MKRGLAVQNARRVLQRRCFSSSRRLNADFTHAVIGAGAVGLAVARELAGKPDTSTILIERHGSVGTETSSRNSEVIHAGIYYGPDSLKTSLCIKGKNMLYDLCNKQHIPYRNTKKWILAQDSQQLSHLESLHSHCQQLSVPAHFLTKRQMSSREPDVRAEAGALESPTTGIIDSHAFMTHLEGDIEARGGDTVFNTAVTRIEPLRHGHGGYKIYTRPLDSAQADDDVIEVETLVNSAGLGAVAVNNMVLPPHRHRTPFYAKGTYFSYASGHPKPSTLLYPAPTPGLGGLGTHLTLDMTGRIRFGPDVEWVADPADYTPNPARLADALAVIQSYLPAVDPAAVDLDYCGIRPKLGETSGTWSPKGTFADFYIEHEESDGYTGFVNLLGIESPGLTSALAIAEMVGGMLYGGSHK